MPSRRQFLAAVTAVPLSTVIPKGAALLACADPVPGTITTQSGPTSFVDAYGQGKQGAAFQWQWPAVLSDKANACAHYRANQIVQSERWLIVVVYGFRDPADTNPTPYPAPGTVVPVVGATTPVDGSSYTASGTWAPHSATCKEQPASQVATAGTVTAVAMTDQAVTYSYDLTFAAGRFTGTVTAPLCDETGCPPRPSRSSCISG